MAQQFNLAAEIGRLLIEAEIKRQKAASEDSRQEATETAKPTESNSTRRTRIVAPVGAIAKWEGTLDKNPPRRYEEPSR